jgi:hypothetical protein
VCWAQLVSPAILNAFYKASNGSLPALTGRAGIWVDPEEAIGFRGTNLGLVSLTTVPGLSESGNSWTNVSHFVDPSTAAEDDHISLEMRVFAFCTCSGDMTGR